MGKIEEGTAVTYHPTTGREREGVVVATKGSLVSVRLEGDPFPVDVPFGQLRRKDMAEALGLKDVKALRKQAAKLDIPDWEGMSIEELQAAVATAEKEWEDSSGRSEPEEPDEDADDTDDDEEDEDEEDSDGDGGEDEANGPKMIPPKEESPKKPTAKKGKAKSKPAAKAKPKPKAKAAPKKAPKNKPEGKKPASAPKAKSNGKNPYRENSSLAFIFDEFLKGGSVEAIGTKVAKRFPINVRSDKVKNVDEHILLRSKARVIRVARALKKQGHKIKIDGKGLDAKIKVTV